MSRRPTRRARQVAVLKSLIAENIGDLSVGFLLFEDGYNGRHSLTASILHAGLLVPVSLLQSSQLIVAQGSRMGSTTTFRNDAEPRATIMPTPALGTNAGRSAWIAESFAYRTFIVATAFSLDR
jgi:hypothetical protein